MYKRHATLFFAVCFLSGIFISAFFHRLLSFSFFYIPQYYFLGFFILGLLLAQFFGHLKIVAVALILVGFLLGIFAYCNYSDREIVLMNSELHISAYNDKGAVNFIGKILNYPDFRIDKAQYEIEAILVGGKPISGKILLTANHYPVYEYGDILEISGKIRMPVESPDFNYKDYLAKDGIYSVIYYPKIKKIGEASGAVIVFWKNIFSFRDKLRESFYRIFPAPHSAILSAMILGDQGLMSKGLREKLSLTGTQHIISISGMNIVILTGILELIGLRLGLWRKHIFYFSTGVIVFYIFMIGAPASAARAGIMGVILLFAQNSGKISDNKRILILAAGIMLALNPLLLNLDIGFQLSFLAIIGIMYLQKPFEILLKFVPEKWFWGFFPLRSVAAMSLAAQITTLPVVVYNFGNISFIAPFANILIVPLLGFIMLYGLASAIGGIFFAPVFIYLSWPLYAVLVYVIFMINSFSKIPLSFIKLDNGIWIFLLTIICVFTVFIIKKIPQQS
ncbi:MAG: ComEC/Rec2 family competence protein [Patescibacteria group bacterium]